MLKVSALAGLVLGLGISAVATYQPARTPVAMPNKVVPQVTLPAPTTMSDGTLFSVWVEGQEIRAGRYAHNIPFMRIGNRIICINGDVHRAD